MTDQTKPAGRATILHSLILAAVVLVAPASAQEARDVTFENHSGVPVFLYWVNFDQKEEKLDYPAIPDGGSYVEGSYVGHRFLLKTEGGETLGEYTVTAEANQTFTAMSPGRQILPNDWLTPDQLKQAESPIQEQLDTGKAMGPTAWAMAALKDARLLLIYVSIYEELPDDASRAKFYSEQQAWLKQRQKAVSALADPDGGSIIVLDQAGKHMELTDKRIAVLQKRIDPIAGTTWTSGNTRMIFNMGMWTFLIDDAALGKGTYKLAGSKLTLTSDDDRNFNVTKLDDQVLEFYIESEFFDLKKQ